MTLNTIGILSFPIFFLVQVPTCILCHKWLQLFCCCFLFFFVRWRAFHIFNLLLYIHYIQYISLPDLHRAMTINVVVAKKLICCYAAPIWWSRLCYHQLKTTKILCSFKFVFADVWLSCFFGFFFFLNCFAFSHVMCLWFLVVTVQQKKYKKYWQRL